MRLRRATRAGVLGCAQAPSQGWKNYCPRPALGGDTVILTENDSNDKQDYCANP